MAVIVTKEGVAPQDKVYEGKCTACKGEVEFKRSDATEHSDGRNGWFLSVKCPTRNCGKRINVDL